MAGNIFIVQPKERFKQISTALISNPQIDCLTLGLYAKILTLGRTWSLNVKGLSTTFGVSDAKVRKSIALLESEGFISRHAVKDDNGKFSGYDYRFYPEALEESERTSAGKRSTQKADYPENGLPQKPGTPKTDYPESDRPNIYKPKEYIDLNNEDTSCIAAEPNPRGTSEPRKCLFENSRFNNYGDFYNCFSSEEYKDIDIAYYYNRIADWSASNGAMKKDWIAATRNWMRSDNEAGKLHKIQPKPKTVQYMGYEFTQDEVETIRFEMIGKTEEEARDWLQYYIKYKKQ